MNTKFDLMMLMITAVILVSDAKADGPSRCVSAWHCRLYCQSIGCKLVECTRISSDIIRCRCKLCSK
uniref:AKTx n=1 Tax=Hadrurus spadix TaxID=141984 RepID=A0A1W7RB40_9SCOR